MFAPGSWFRKAVGHGLPKPQRALTAAYEPHRWFLLEDAGALFLDVDCNHSFIGYVVLVQLTSEEAVAYREKGRAYLTWLSEEIHNSVPILRASRSPYKARNVLSIHRERVSAAVDAWRSSGAGVADF